MRPGQRLPLHAHSLDEEGRGVGEAGDHEVRVFDLLPGERAEVEIEHVSPHGGRAWGRVIARAGPASPQRAIPACPAFGRCGGCTVQHLAYPAQLEEKRRRVVKAVAHLGVEVEATVPSPRVLGYRSRGKYVAARERGALTLGAYAPRTHQVVETLGCQVVEPVVDAAARRARDALEASGLEVYDERSRRGELRYVIARSGADGNALVGIVTTSTARPELVRAAGEAIARKADVAGAVWIRNDTRTGAILSADVEVLAGAGEIVEEVGPARAAIDITAFSQVNREQARRLYQAAAKLAQAGAGVRAVELYCGTGGIALELAEAGAEVVGIERHEPAVAVARRAAASLGMSERAQFSAADAATAGALSPRPVPDVVVIDPPRKGLSPEALDALVAVGAPTIVYVSCGPASFARDAAALIDRGYALDTVQPWDLMPGTPQVEILARFLY